MGLRQFQSRTYAPGLFAHFYPSCIVSSIVSPLLPKVTFTLSIQPNLGLPLTRPPLTSAVDTFQAMRYPLILSCPNLLNTCDPVYQATTLSIHDTPTKLLKHFISRTATFFFGSSHTPCLCPIPDI